MEEHKHSISDFPEGNDDSQNQNDFTPNNDPETFDETDPGNRESDDESDDFLTSGEDAFGGGNTDDEEVTGDDDNAGLNRKDDDDFPDAGTNSFPSLNDNQ